MYAGADWSNYLYTQNFPNVQGAIWKAPSAATFFFYCRDAMTLQNGRQFKPGDAVYFAGVPEWGSAEQCDGYYLNGACLNPYNFSVGGACPSDLEGQYRKWGNKLVDGGFIWLYDSILGCSLANCCDGKVATALAYSKAITNGLRFLSTNRCHDARTNAHSRAVVVLFSLLPSHSSNPHSGVSYNIVNGRLIVGSVRS